jgi:hypothetical protein
MIYQSLNANNNKKKKIPIVGRRTFQKKKKTKKTFPCNQARGIMSAAPPGQKQNK